jgi:hypothetical protein
MIIKSLSRKARSTSSSGGRSGGAGPFSALARYMNRGIEKEDGKAVLWHNFFGSERMSEAEIVAEFEENFRLLQERKNGNVLYHEILSFSSGYRAQGNDLEQMVADIGQEYLRERAPDQLAYGVIHRGTDHIHLHLMISANEAGKSDRVRLSKKEFAEAQKRVERYAIERYPDLSQTKIYDRERPKERLKTDAQEQAMKARTGAPSRKEQVKATMHQIFARANSYQELAELSKASGISFYQRGKTVGVIVKEPDGTERKHRLATLGVEEHYQATNERLSQAQQKPKDRPQPRRDQQTPPTPEVGKEDQSAPPPEPRPEPRTYHKDIFRSPEPQPESEASRSSDALRREAEERLEKEQHQTHEKPEPKPEPRKYHKDIFAHRSHRSGKRKAHDLPMRSGERPRSVLKKSSAKHTKSQNPSPSRGSTTRIFSAHRSRSQKVKPHDLPMRSGVKLRNYSGIR